MDYSPLTASIVKSLTDKLYEKRKVAAIEIEKMIKEYMQQNKPGQICKLIDVLGQEFALSQNQNNRKGGLIGLASTAIALGKDSSLYVNKLVSPVLACFNDSDCRIRYYSCEALYNIIKVARSTALPLFNNIFDGLSKLAADADQNVRSGSELLDRLLKDIVVETHSFDLVSFIPLLRERILTKNSFARQFIVSWIITLDAIPEFDMLIYLPELLDGLFQILGDQNPEIRQRAETCLGEFLLNITKNKDRIDYPAMINVINVHSQSLDPLTQFTAIVWLKEFVALSGPSLLPFTSGILTSVLPCLSFTEDKSNIRENAIVVNAKLMNLVSIETSIKKDQVSRQSTPITCSEENAPPQEEIYNIDLLNVASIVSVLTTQLGWEYKQTRIASLVWLQHLLDNLPDKLFIHIEDLFPILLKKLQDPSDEVVLLDLKFFVDISTNVTGHEINTSSFNIPLNFISSHGLNKYFNKFMLSLTKLFSSDHHMLDTKASFIIRHLCISLHSEDVYCCFSEILMIEEDLHFASQMIKILSCILLTTPELFKLRNTLKNLNSKDSCNLFCCLYKSWCHNPVATIALCFISQNYQHALNILTLFGDIEVTVEFLAEIDRLVQLIESPIFSYLRLQLLDTDNNAPLIKSLYGLLMLLPQSDAFFTLHHRLQCIPSGNYMLQFSQRVKTDASPTKFKNHQHIEFIQLLKQFQNVQNKHKEIILLKKPDCSPKSDDSKK